MTEMRRLLHDELPEDNYFLLKYILQFLNEVGKSSSSSSPFPTRWGQWPEFLISWVSSGVIRSACISLRTPSIHLPLGLPRLFPGTLMSPIALTSLFSSILCMCPYQRSLISLTFSCMLFTQQLFTIQINNLI